VLLPALVDEWAAEPGWDEVDVVGFSSTFEQNVASLAVAGALKRRHPHLVTVFGGANLDGVMGLEQVRSFDAIDYAVIGEGEVAFPLLLAAIASGGDPLAVQGVAARRDGAVVASGATAPIEDLDTTPLPDYDDYFLAIRHLQRDLQGVELGQRLPIETARGCWWGQKHHCTFCGLNGQTMRVRSKSPERALADLMELSARHEVNTFHAVDNILDLRYLPRLLQPLAETDYDFSLFYEIKANLTRQQVRALRLAGIDTVQPGIESLSTSVLRRMRKGTTMLQNVRLLKWALYYGITVNWNLLMGFPGESAEDYDGQRELIPLLHHLEPPSGAARIWLERFSPLFAERDALRDVRPLAAYALTYPETVDLDQLAYFFDYECDDLPPLHHYRSFMAAVEDWKKAWAGERRPVLVCQHGNDWLRIHDSRGDVVEEHVLRGDRAAVLHACGDRELSAAKITDAVRADGVEASASRVDDVLTELRERRLVVSDDDQHLSLAVPWRVR
jgi:ribosomal peptide maturation radical SAM protein 1